MTRGGDAYELPTLVLPTDGLESSSLLPTPTTAPTTGNGHARNLGGEIRLMPTLVVNDMGAGKTVERWDEWTAEVKAKHNNGNGHGPSLSIEMLRLLPTPRTSDTNGAGEHGTGGLDLRTAVTLLPTPVARDWKGYGPSDADRHSPNLAAVPLLLPTPRATDGTKGGPNQRGSSGDLMLPSAVQMFSGASTSPPSDDGNARLYDLHPDQLSLVHEADRTSPRVSWNG